MRKYHFILQFVIYIAFLQKQVPPEQFDTFSKQPYEILKPKKNKQKEKKGKEEEKGASTKKPKKKQVEIDEEDFGSTKKTIKKKIGTDAETEKLFQIIQKHVVQFALKMPLVITDS